MGDYTEDEYGMAEELQEEAAIEEPEVGLREEEPVEENSIEEISEEEKLPEEEPQEEKASAEKEKKVRKRFQLNVSIKLQLIVGFLVPIAFVILVGIASYKKAESGMIKNFENSAENTIKTEMEYLDFGLSLIHSDAVQMKLDTELQSLVGGTYKNDTSKAATVYNKSISNLNVKQTLNGFIKDIYIVPKADNKLMSTTKKSSADVKGFYEVWAATEEGSKVAKGESGWVGVHPEMDALTGYDPEKYILSYMSVFSNKAAAVIVDISAENVKETLQAVDVTEGVILGFITADNRELIVKEDTNPTEIVFSEQSFYQECAAGEEILGTKYVTYDGKDYLYIFCKSEETGATLGYLVPKIKVTASAAEIKSITVILVIVACIIALVIALFISLNVSMSMGNIIKHLKKVAAGDLTVQMRIKGNSEFSVLSRHIMEVISNTRNLIQEVEKIVAMVSGAAENVGDASQEVVDSSQGIMRALVEIDAGVSQQAGDAQDCLVQMDGLSQTIERIGEDISYTVKSSEDTKGVVNTGIQAMEALSGQTKDTIKVTSAVKESIKSLEEKSAEIKGFAAIIADIAEQTNLLSLNASIEAARAGDAGRGFAVVAEEIRKLADGSQQAANEINKVVEMIAKQTEATVGTAVKAEKIVEQQAQSVGETKKAFGRIYESTEEVLDNIQKIADYVNSMDSQRGGTLEAISSISAVSEETAASSENVSSIAQRQLEVVESLESASGELKSKMVELEEALKIFTIN